MSKVIKISATQHAIWAAKAAGFVLVPGRSPQAYQGTSTVLLQCGKLPSLAFDLVHVDRAATTTGEEMLRLHIIAKTSQA